MSAKQMVLTVLATKIAQAVATKLAQAVATDNDDPDGHDIASGLYGPAVSEWLREVAKELARTEPHVWTRVVDEALTSYHLDVANESDDYATAKGKMENLLAHAGNVGAYHAAEQAEPYTYASTQSTKCASCGERKHTPLRIDAMGGYVCLTCIDQKLGSLLGAFGYPSAEQAEPVPARQEPLFLLHTGQIDSEGEQDEWDIEANSWVSVEEFCLAHPGQTIGLHPQPLPAAPITAAPPAPARQEWRPIETAPKDQFILVSCPSGYTTTPRVATTAIMRSGYKAGRWVDHANDDLTDWGMVPTHWQPLPAAPITAAPAEGGA